MKNELSKKGYKKELDSSRLSKGDREANEGINKIKNQNPQMASFGAQ